MAQYDRFNAIILIGDSSKRGQLKQAALAITAFHKVFPAPVMTEALTRLNGYEDVDVVFISLDFGWDKIAEFIKEAKETQRGQDSAFVLVLKPTDENEETKTKSVFVGVHSCLYEPYSADNLRVITQIAARIKEEGSKRRERAALQAMLAEIMKHIDALSYYQKNNMNPAPVLRKLKVSCEALVKLGEEAQQIYKELALELFEAAKPFGTTEYSGVGQRIKDIVQKKLAQRLATEYV